MARIDTKKIDKVVRKDDGRLNLVIDDELKVWAQEYASRQRTSLSGLVSALFLDLRHRDEAPDAKQI